MSPRRRRTVVLAVVAWIGGSSLAGAVIGLSVGLFKQGGIEPPIVIISVLFGNVVGLTAMVTSAVLVPRLSGLVPALRLAMLGLGLFSGAVAGSIAVLNLYPLFVFRDPRQALAVVALNGLLALIVGAVVYGYEDLRLRLVTSLREVEEVRLVEARLREEAARAELAALQARINPHFFFNTLNTISSLLAEDPDEAEEIVQRLADLFRYTFKAAGQRSVPLGEELAFVRGYLEIERARFGERLAVDWRVDPDTLDIGVPGLILQPLVENAVAHGIAPRAAGGRVTIAGRVEHGRLLLEVADDGAGLAGGAAAPFADGHGLDNVRRRLATVFGERAELVLEPDPAGRGTRARIALPLGARPKEPR